MQAKPPAWAMLDAPLKQVQTIRLKSLATGNPSENRSCFGTTVQPRRALVNPAYLLKEAVSIATYNNNKQIYASDIQLFFTTLANKH